MQFEDVGVLDQLQDRDLPLHLQGAAVTGDSPAGVSLLPGSALFLPPSYALSLATHPPPPPPVVPRPCQPTPGSPSLSSQLPTRVSWSILNFVPLTHRVTSGRAPARPPHLHQYRLAELLPVDDLDGHLLARDTVDPQLHQAWGDSRPQTPSSRATARTLPLGPLTQPLGPWAPALPGES